MQVPAKAAVRTARHVQTKYVLSVMMACILINIRNASIAAVKVSLQLMVR